VSRPPSGEQHEIAHGARRAVIVEVGGGLRTFSANGRQLMDGYRVDQMCSSGRGQVLIPWPNRLEDGRYEFAGRQHQLPLTEVSTGTAIHGLVRWATWTVREQEPHRVVMEHVLHAQPGYPFTLELRIAYELSDDGLQISTTATNAGADVVPYGAGAHPYLTVGTEMVDAAILQVPAGTVVIFDERGLPSGTRPVDGTAYDFREPRPVGEAVLDNAFTDLGRREDGRAYVELAAPDGPGLALWVDEHYPFVMVFTGDPLPDVARRSVALEPMTCPPNAFRTRESLIFLEPGSPFTSTWGITPRR
jgi:aldose 1-epimerase